MAFAYAASEAASFAVAYGLPLAASGLDAPFDTWLLAVDHCVVVPMSGGSVALALLRVVGSACH